MAEQESMLSMDETSSFETSNFQKMSDVTQGQHELSSNNVSQHLVFSLDLPAIKNPKTILSTLVHIIFLRFFSLHIFPNFCLYLLTILPRCSE